MSIDQTTRERPFDEPIGHHAGREDNTPLRSSLDDELEGLYFDPLELSSSGKRRRPQALAVELLWRAQREDKKEPVDGWIRGVREDVERVVRSDSFQRTWPRVLLLLAALFNGINFTELKTIVGKAAVYSEMIEGQFDVSFQAAAEYLVGALLLLPFLIPPTLSRSTLPFTSFFPSQPDISPPSSPAAIGNLLVEAAQPQPALPTPDGPPRRLLLGGALSGVLVGLGFITGTLGLSCTRASTCALLDSLVVVMVPLLEGVLGRPVGLRTWGAAAMGVMGVASLEMASPNASLGLGDLLCLCQALFISLSLVAGREFLKQDDSSSPASVQIQTEHGLAFSAARVCSAAVLVSLWAVVHSIKTHTWPAFQLLTMPTFAVPILYTGLFSVALTAMLESIGLVRVKASEVSIILLTEPVFAAGFAALMLGDRLGPHDLVGGALICSGCLLSPHSEGGVKEDDEES
ncbi:unnamed protein product [Vitrella brassicaformis CCMP3155]|uniref:EamA domain-containing protein n=2 Tax=Vitrella brassicaformis TaxID=1169539 RepID=A0A0G4FH54_VITBC|nr:unnamed protein product [Vitrella brassicaformis CCMP3155]|eukprot:CEM12620.1 unnamed protein product [Vitrella brassicaformis CCMP3155]